MGLPKVDLSIKNVAAALALIQGLAWTIMALVCIIVYHSSPPTNEITSYMDTVQRNIYTIFLYTDQPAFTDQTFTADVFGAFVWIYFVLNLAWIGGTIYMIRKNTPKSMKEWSYCTLFICFWDFITFVILGADYDKCLDYAASYGESWGVQAKIDTQAVCANTILPVFFIAAKGFVLWILNIVLGILVLRTSKQTTSGIGGV